MRKNRLGESLMEPLSTRNATASLRSYCLLSQVVGWPVLVMGLLGLSILVTQSIQSVASGEPPEMVESLLGLFERSWVPLLTTGLILLFVSHVLRHLYNSGTDRSLLLRYGHIVLYAFMFLVLYRTIGATVVGVAAPGGTVAARMLNVAPTLFLNAARLLIFFGLLQFLKRIRPDKQEVETSRATHVPSV